MKNEAGEKLGGWEKQVTAGRCLAAACCVLGLSAMAQEVGADATSATARAEAPVWMEVNTSSVPRLDAQENSFQAPRVDLSLLPPGGNGLGFAVGMSGLSQRDVPAPTFGPAARPNLDVGLRYRQTVDSRQVDITAWRRMTQPQDVSLLAQQNAPLYGARVEMKLSPAKTPLFADKGFVGFQLESGARIQLRRSQGRPMVYYRNTF